MHFGFDEEQRQFQESVRQFARQRRLEATTSPTTDGKAPGQMSTATMKIVVKVGL